ncbi:MAG: xylan 1,4-beta-xylosidase [Oscillospiraceae bacterium]|nr:xylan 1,4-beta-xylosidase [Oscillospiraceae bacterium]
MLDTFAVGDQNILIVADRETGVQYMTNEQFSGFSPLLDADGKPLIARF